MLPDINFYPNNKTNFQLILESFFASMYISIDFNKGYLHFNFLAPSFDLFYFQSLYVESLLRKSSTEVLRMYKEEFCQMTKW